MTYSKVPAPENQLDRISNGAAIVDIAMARMTRDAIAEVERILNKVDLEE
jgi:cobalamin-dependent methionine synthase I